MCPNKHDHTKYYCPYSEPLKPPSNCVERYSASNKCSGNPATYITYSAPSLTDFDALVTEILLHHIANLIIYHIYE